MHEIYKNKNSPIIARDILYHLCPVERWLQDRGNIVNVFYDRPISLPVYSLNSKLVVTDDDDDDDSYCSKCIIEQALWVCMGQIIYCNEQRQEEKAWKHGTSSVSQPGAQYLFDDDRIASTQGRRTISTDADCRRVSLEICIKVKENENEGREKNLPLSHTNECVTCVWYPVVSYSYWHTRTHRVQLLGHVVLQLIQITIVMSQSGS